MYCNDSPTAMCFKLMIIKSQLIKTCTSIALNNVKPNKQSVQTDMHILHSYLLSQLVQFVAEYAWVINKDRITRRPTQAIILGLQEKCKQHAWARHSISKQLTRW
jgi:hypothetical protein